MGKQKAPSELTDEDLEQIAGGRPVAQWSFQNAWPSKYSGPALSAKGSGDVAMEELSISHEGLKLE